MRWARVALQEEHVTLTPVPQLWAGRDAPPHLCLHALREKETGQEVPFRPQE